jgi:hypothetical protein
VTGPANPGDTASAPSHEIHVGPAPIRRLNHVEYNNTLHDLLGDVSAPADHFPAQEKRLGFNNNAVALSVSPVLAEQYMLAAEAAAERAVTSHLAEIVPCDPLGDGADACERRFIASFGTRAYRRPPSDNEIATLTAIFNAGKAIDFVTGVRLVIETALQSPRFLYRVELGAPPGPGEAVARLDDWEMASRLSYLLWNTMPDDALLAAARAGTLRTPQEISAQVTRMVDDPRTRSKVSEFQDEWLRVDEIDAVQKESNVFPDFTPAVAALMRQETSRFLDYVVWEGDGDLETILTAPYTFLNGPLAQYYGIPGVTGDELVKTAVDPTQRGGLLTQGGLLSLLSRANQTSPVYRGKFVREQLLCMELPPPPANLLIKPPDLSATLTTRQRFAAHASDPYCSGCHRLMDPIGLGFENFDGAGRFRTSENGQPIDASGEVLESDVAGPFDGALALQGKLAASEQVRTCVATNWFRYGAGRDETEEDAASLALIHDRFAKGGHKIRDLIVAFTETDAFLYRRVTPPVGDGS